MTARDAPSPGVPTGPGPSRVAVAQSLLAALLSAAYFVLVAAIAPTTRPSAILVEPFLIGGLAYGAWSVGIGEGRAFLRIWTDPMAYLRTGMLVAFQLALLAAVYLTGPVDASLLSFFGDVAATPLVAVLFARADRSLMASGWFVAGLGLSLAGGTLTIIGGRSLAAIPPLGWIVVPVVPLALAGYVLLSAHANERTSPSAVVGQTMLGAGLISLLVVPAVPGAFPGLVPPDGLALGILIALGLTAFFGVPLLYFAAIQRIGPTLPPVLMTGIPVLTLVLSWTVLHLPVLFGAALGIPIAVLGGVLALRGVAAQPSSPA